MEEGIQQILQDVQYQLAELATRKKEFEEQMKQQKEEFEIWKQSEAEKMKQELEDAAIRQDLELIEREKKISAQEEFIRDQHLKNSKTIKLKVGGKQFITTITTLTSDKDSMLAAMFSGRHVLEKDENGFCFIDRDGGLFSLVLRYLRTGRIPENLDDANARDLKHEAQYYQLSGLLKELNQRLPTNTGVLNYGGLYVNERRTYSFIDSKLVTNFSDTQEYTIDYYFNTFKFNLDGAVVGIVTDKNSIQIANVEYAYHPPALPDIGTAYSGRSSTIIFKEKSVVIQKTAHDSMVDEIQTTTSTSKNGDL